LKEQEALKLVETNLGSVLGTVSYMSPEQARGARVDKRTDIWSLGVVIVEMVTGQAPFTGSTPGEVMSSILEKQPLPLTRDQGELATELQKIVTKALRKNAAERFQSANETAEALKHPRHHWELATGREQSTARHS